jgi:hypothetical protein
MSTGARTSRTCLKKRNKDKTNQAHSFIPTRLFGSVITTGIDWRKIGHHLVYCTRESETQMQKLTCDPSWPEKAAKEGGRLAGERPPCSSETKKLCRSVGSLVLEDAVGALDPSRVLVVRTYLKKGGMDGQPPKTLAFRRRPKNSSFLYVRATKRRGCLAWCTYPGVTWGQ